MPIDDTYYDCLWEMRDLRTPEPTTSITFTASERKFRAEMAKQANVWFYGEGPDNALTFEWKPYLRWLWQSGDWPRFGNAIVQYLRSKQACEWRTTFKTHAIRWRKEQIDALGTAPRWMNDAFVKKVDLAARLHGGSLTSEAAHPWRPRAIASFTSSIWPSLLEGFDLLFQAPQLSGGIHISI